MAENGVTNGENSSTKAFGKENPSLQVTADHRIKMVPAPIIKPGHGEVLLHVKTTGICGYEVLLLSRCRSRTADTMFAALIFTFGNEALLARLWWKEIVSYNSDCK